MSTTYNVTKKPVPDKYSRAGKSLSSRLRELGVGECLEARGDISENSLRGHVSAIGTKNGLKFRVARTLGGYDIFRIS